MTNRATRDPGSQRTPNRPTVSGEPQPVVIQGLGPIGRSILEGATRDAQLEVVGAVDIHPSLVGKPLHELAPQAKPGLRVAEYLDEVDAPPDTVVLQATGSWLPDVFAQLVDAIDEGLHVVSTCEELVWPWSRHPDLSRRLDEAARTAGSRIVGTGVNPGFLMDQLPVFLTAASHGVKAVSIERVIDPRARRLPFQRKIGLDITREEYEERHATGRFGHVGLEESGQLLAAGLGWRIRRWEETLQPVQPDPQGRVLGLIQTLHGEDDDGRSIDLRFVVHGGVTESYDVIDLQGTPPLRLRFEGGVFGDDATAAAVLRAARLVRSAPAGLISVLDLPLRPWPR